MKKQQYAFVTFVGLVTPSQSLQTLCSRQKQWQSAIPASALLATIIPIEDDVFEELTWKAKLPDDSTWIEKAQYKQQTQTKYWSCQASGDPLPVVLPPPSRSGQLVVEGFYEQQGNKPLVRFGITTQSGPPFPLSDDTLRALGTSSSGDELGSMAMIFVWVDPEYRGLDWGQKAVRIIRQIHQECGADCTVLVANDKGSGRLVPWYERQGFVAAPELQDLLGSPDKVYGTTMIGLTDYAGDDYDTLDKGGVVIKWW